MFKTGGGDHDACKKAGAVEYRNRGFMSNGRHANRHSENVPRKTRNTINKVRKEERSPK